MVGVNDFESRSAERLGATGQSRMRKGRGRDRLCTSSESICFAVDSTRDNVSSSRISPPSSLPCRNNSDCMGSPGDEEHGSRSLTPGAGSSVPLSSFAAVPHLSVYRESPRPCINQALVDELKPLREMRFMVYGCEYLVQLVCSDCRA